MTSIYMISLKRDHARKKLMQKQFPEYYPKIQIIEAVDAQAKSNHSLINNFMHPCKNDKRRPLTQGEKCCAISHLLALEEFLKTDQERCIIIEDDIIGCDADFDTAISITKSIQTKGLVIFGGQQGLKNARFLCGMSTSVNKLWCIPNLSKNFITRACCYSLDRTTAISILNSQKNCLTRADNWQTLISKKTSIFYANIFEHPKDYIQSNLEEERNAHVSVYQKIKSDGVLNIIKRALYKILNIFLCKVGVYEKVDIK